MGTMKGFHLVRVRVRVRVRVGVSLGHDKGVPPRLVIQIEAEGGDVVRLVRGRGRGTFLLYLLYSPYLPYSRRAWVLAHTFSALMSTW